MKDRALKVCAAVPKIRLADTGSNSDAVIALSKKAAELGAKICVFPELCLTGSTCGDLFLHETLLKGAECALLKVAEETAELEILTAVGLPVLKDGRIYNCAALISGGKVLSKVPKKHLSYGEKRWFSEGKDGEEIQKGLLEARKLTGVKLGVIFGGEPFSLEDDTELILSPSAQKALVGSAEARRRDAVNFSCELKLGYVFSNAGEGESTTDAVYMSHGIIAQRGEIVAEELCGGEIALAELCFSELSMPKCEKIAAFSTGKEENATVSPDPFMPSEPCELAEACREIITIQSLGLKQRMEHTGAKKLVIGVSGGLDSTLAMLVAAKTLKMLGLPKENLVAVTMPCFGTTERTKGNAQLLSECLGSEFKTVDIGESVKRHFADIGHDFNDHNVVFENAQARERTQVLMDMANGTGALVVGTGDMSELSIGWATFNGDHMSMYGVNAGVTKTQVRKVIAYCAKNCGNAELSNVLYDILDTPVSPELLPAEKGDISQKTEDIVGPYELHDFFLWHLVGKKEEPERVLSMAKEAFCGIYDEETVLKWLKTFIRRFFAQQFKRSCLPDGPQVNEVTLSPRGGLSMPSDAVSKLWLSALEVTNE